MDGGWRAARRLMPGLMLIAVSGAHGADCSVSTSDLNFGSYDPVSSNATAPSDGATAMARMSTIAAGTPSKDSSVEAWPTVSGPSRPASAAVPTPPAMTTASAAP